MPVNLDEIGPMRLLLHFLGRLVSSSHFKKASGAANRGKFKAGEHLSSRHTTAQLVLKVSWTPKVESKTIPFATPKCRQMHMLAVSSLQPSWLARLGYFGPIFPCNGKFFQQPSHPWTTRFQVVSSCVSENTGHGMIRECTWLSGFNDSQGAEEDVKMWVMHGGVSLI